MTPASTLQPGTAVGSGTGTGSARAGLPAWGQFCATTALLLGALVLIHLRGNLDRVPASEPLASFPMQVGLRTGTDLPLAPETLEVLGKGIFLSREYALPETAMAPVPASPVPAQDQAVATRPDMPTQVPEAAVPGAAGSAAGRAAESSPDPISLFIAYFPTQRSGQSIHSPQNCLPGAGWSFESSGTLPVPTADGGKPMQVGEYLISNGTSRAEVLYWYQSHGRSIANDYKAKFWMLLDAIRMGRTDAALVRIVTVLGPGESRASARARVLGFAEHIAPALPRFVPN